MLPRLDGFITVDRGQSWRWADNLYPRGLFGEVLGKVEAAYCKECSLSVSFVLPALGMNGNFHLPRVGDSR